MAAGTKKQRHPLYNWQWTQARNLYLKVHPLCVMCQQQGRVTAAAVVDHIKPHKGDTKLFWDQANWQAVCRPHHDGAAREKDRTGIVRGCGADGLPLDPSHPWAAGR